MCSSMRCATTSASVSLVKRVAALGELGAQLLVVLDDAVEDDRDAAAAVAVRVGVLLAGPAVRRPARVAEADAWPRSRSRPRPRRARRGCRRRARRRCRSGSRRAMPGRVVAAVLQAPEAVEDDGLAGTSPDVAYDAAHACSLPWVGRRWAGCGRHPRVALSPPLPAGFVDSITTVPGREASAESFDEPPPRHPRGPLPAGARRAGQALRLLTGVRTTRSALSAGILPRRAVPRSPRPADAGYARFTTAVTSNSTRNSGRARIAGCT